MKKDKKRNKSKKLALLSMAAILPMATTGVIATTIAPATTSAATTSASYQKSYIQEVSLTNSNFNSSSSTTLNSSPSGWSKRLSDKKSTAGVINTGSSFQRYMTSTYYLSKNPGTDASDSHILMINSRTEDSGDYALSREGFRSNSVTLAANSYYSFKVAFKSSTNFESVTSYEVAGHVEANTQMTRDTFKAKAFKLNENGEIEDEYISFTYHTHTYYILKSLDTENTTQIEGENGEDLVDVDIFYDDGNFVGFLYGEENTPVYVKKTDTTDPTENDSKVNVKNGVTAYQCKNIKFVPDSGSKTSGVFKIDEGTDYFNSKTTQNPLNADSRGSIYLDGLKNDEGATVKAEYVGANSKQWVTYNFFIATGDQSQTVNLELWLGSRDGLSSSGVVFFDNVRVNQYSENSFWKAYQENYDAGYDIAYSEGPAEHKNCTQLFDFRVSKDLSAKDLSISENETPDFNFDFEKGVYNDDPTTLKGWEKDENSTGKARIFDVGATQEFKSVTGYDYVGSDLSYDVELEETDEEFPRLKVKASTENKYMLGLWTEKNNVKVTSQAIKIESQKVYKITAKYKVSDITEGSAYVFVKENDALVKKYVDDGSYTLAPETSSTSISSNASNNFTNNFGTIEFFVRGGISYDSAINVSLGLGKTDESSTGCVVFDDIKIEKASLEDYNNASNKIQLGSSAPSTTVTNGDFDLVKVNGDENGLFAAQNWTITKGNGFVFNGVVNTDKEKYAKYSKEYETYKKETNCNDIDNPYYWATYSNPGSSHRYASDIPDNVLALGNVSNSWQKLKSENLSLSANSAYNASEDKISKLSFQFKTQTSGQGFKITVFQENGMKLYESENLTSSNWQEYAIYFKSFPGATNIYFEIDFGTEKVGATGIVYLDRFTFEDADSDISGEKNVVDMSDFGLNLPTNSITSNLDTFNSPAYTGSVTSSDGNNVGGGIVKGNFFEEDSPYYVKDAQDKNFFFLYSGSAGAYTFESNFNIDLESSSYYVLSFKAKTFFNYLNEGTSLDKDKNYDYGLTFGLTGFKYMTNVVSNEEFKEYKLFINSTDAKTAKLHMALVCDTRETGGGVAIYDLAIAKSTEDEFNEAQEAMDAKNFDVNASNTFASTAEDATPDTEETPDENEDTSATNSNNFNWLLIPTLITALAIVIAVVGYFLRKIKIKKIEIKRKNSYDRRTSANVDFIKRKAVEERDNELKGLKTSKEKFEAELEKLETAHKAKIVSLREKDKGTMSKETDKEFKTFAKKRTVIAEKVDLLNKQIEEINSPEHMLSLERKIFAEQEEQRRKLEKASKKAEKEKLKAQSETQNKDKTSSKSKK